MSQARSFQHLENAAAGVNGSAARHRRIQRRGDFRFAGMIVVRQRFLEPGQVEFFQRAAEADRVRHGRALVEINQQSVLVANHRLASLLHAQYHRHCCR